MGREFLWFPQDGKFPKLGNFPGITVREIPGREKFEAIWEGGNGNFPLNIPGLSTQDSFLYKVWALWVVSNAIWAY